MLKGHSSVFNAVAFRYNYDMLPVTAHNNFSMFLQTQKRIENPSHKTHNRNQWAVAWFHFLFPFPLSTGGDRCPTSAFLMKTGLFIITESEHKGSLKMFSIFK